MTGNIIINAVFVQASCQTQVKAARPGADDAAEHRSIDVQIWDLIHSPDAGRERITVQEQVERPFTIGR